MRFTYDTATSNIPFRLYFGCSVHDSARSVTGIAGCDDYGTHIYMQYLFHRIAIPPSQFLIFDSLSFGCNSCKKLVTQSSGYHLTATIYFYQGSTLLDSIRYMGSADGVNEQLPLMNVDHISIIPNPATNIAQINIGSANISMLNIYNIQGKLLVSFNKPSHNLIWDTKRFPCGLYIITSSGNRGTQSKMIFLVK
jgi:hypothetical protein